MVKMVTKKLEKKPARVRSQKLTKKVIKKPAQATGQKLTKKMVNELARVSGPMFTHTCRFCDFVGKSESSDKSARSMRDRHEREEHKGGKRARVAHRMLQSKRYMSVYRAEERGDHDVEPAMESVHVYILCTQRREDEHRMFSDTREHLVSRGFKGSNIHMLHGHDVRVSDGHDVRVSGGITKSQFVMWAFLNRFVPDARADMRTSARASRVRAFEPGQEGPRDSQSFVFNDVSVASASHFSRIGLRLNGSGCASNIISFVFLCLLPIFQLEEEGARNRETHSAPGAELDLIAKFFNTKDRARLALSFLLFSFVKK